jgi:hypothetical protein
VRGRVAQVTRRVPHSFAYFANEWALRAAIVSKSLHRTSFDLQRPLLKVHSHQTRLATPVRRKAASPQVVRKTYRPRKRSPQALKRESIQGRYGTAEAVPSQNMPSQNLIAKEQSERVERETSGSNVCVRTRSSLRDLNGFLDFSQR